MDGLQWEEGQADTAEPGSGGAGGAGRQRQGGRRSSGQGWSSAVAPRFERRAAEVSEERRQQIVYDGEICEAEDLPNGFTKIRSKNLDILFKRDYYEQRLLTQKQLSEDSKEGKNSSEVEDPSEEISEQDNNNKEETESNTDTTEIISEKNMETGGESTEYSPLEKLDPDEIAEFKPMNHGLECLDSGHTSPFLPGYPPFSTGSAEQEFPGHQPNLYLYSPSNNTLIPCEEIIIPNQGETVYTGPTNIYLAYPVQGPDGRSYITQPFPLPGEQGGPGYPQPQHSYYSNSVSYDGSNCYSSTPHTPNSGEESGSSTNPTSPPPLVNYHPANWIKQTEQTILNFPEYPGTEPSGAAPQQESPAPSLPTSQTKPRSASPAPAPPSPAPVTRHIPGLPQTVVTPTNKSQKRRKKKSKSTKAEQQVVGSSEAIHQVDIEIKSAAGAAEESNSDVSSEQAADEFCCATPVDLPASQPVYEIQLTDDLADSLVNPPTDPEVSDDDGSKQFSMEPEEISEVSSVNYDINEHEKPSMAVNYASDVQNEFELEDKEVSLITENIVVSAKGADNEILVENNEVSKDIMEAAIGDIKSPSVGAKKDKKSIQIKLEKKENNKNKKKKDLKSVLNKAENKGELQTNKASEESIQDIKQVNNSSITLESKKSYSSVIKTNLAAGSHPEPAVSPPSKPQPVICAAKPEISPANLSFRTNRQVKKTKETHAVNRRDSWENVPTYVSKNDDSWEKSSKKRKQRKNKINVDEPKHTKETNDDDKIKEVVEIVKQTEENIDISPVEPALPEEVPVTIPKEEEGEQEKKKIKKKKKKQDSESQEETPSRRIIICDDQLGMAYGGLGAGRVGPEVVPVMDRLAATAAYREMLYVSELGAGISRGCMGLGRLYQGKYVPPDRSDILTLATMPGTMAEEEDDKKEESERMEEVMEEQESSVSLSNDTELDLD